MCVFSAVVEADEMAVLQQMCLLRIYSPKGLLGTPVQFLINAIILSTNHMAVASMHLGVKTISLTPN